MPPISMLNDGIATSDGLGLGTLSPMIPRIVERISSLLSSIEQPPLFRDPKYPPDIKRIGSSPGASTASTQKRVLRSSFRGGFAEP
jgi:hypothetical protein